MSTRRIDVQLVVAVVCGASLIGFVLWIVYALIVSGVLFWLLGFALLVYLFGDVDFGPYVPPANTSRPFYNDSTRGTVYLDDSGFGPLRGPLGEIYDRTGYSSVRERK